MASTIKHRFVSGIADGGDATLVRPSNWNDVHDALTQVEVNLRSTPRRTGKFRISTAHSTGIDFTGVLPYPASVLTDAPSSYWKLDDAVGATSVTDYIGAVTGTVSNVTFGGTGIDVTSVLMVNNGSYLDFGDNYGFPGASNPFSVEMWIAPNDITSANLIVSKAGADGHGWSLVMGTTGHLKMIVEGNSSSNIGTLTLTAGTTFQQLVLTFDGTTATVYVNGAPSGTQASFWIGTLTATTGTFRVNFASGGLGTAGSFDELGVYPYVLSAARVLAHYNARSGMIGESPVTTSKALVQQAANAYTGKGTRPDESQMDDIQCRPVVLDDGSIDVYWSSPTFVWKNVKFNYMVAG